MAFLLLVIQGLIAVSPIGEPRGGGNALQIHVEAQGSSHADLHSDDTCALCAARNAFAAPQVPVAPLTQVGRFAAVAADREIASPSADGSSAHLSRAPPAPLG
jgi:hypothetical protein